MTTATLANARDLSTAWPTLVPGIAFRSDAPLEGDEPAPGLDPWPPATVVDLRAAVEKRHPNALASSCAVMDIEVLAEANLVGTEERPAVTSLDSLYAHMIEGAAAAALVRATEAVATAPAPVMFHCSVGKDRTGLLAALILSLVGAPREAIVADYAATAQHMPQVIERMMRGVSPEFARLAVAQIPPEVLDAPAAAIEAVLDAWDEAGGAEAWYLANGGASDVLATLRSRLIPDAM